MVSPGDVNMDEKWENIYEVGNLVNLKRVALI